MFRSAAVSRVLARRHAVARCTRTRPFSASSRLHDAMSVAGKTAIVTGAGSGINLSFTSLLLSKGCNVVMADLALTPAAERLLSAPQESGARAIFKKTDVASFPQLEALFPFTSSSGLGVPDIVVPGAGVYEPDWSSFFRGDAVGIPNSRYRTLDINLTHPIHLTRLAVDAFLAADKRQGAVIHISSVAAQVAPVFTPLYNASKAAVSHFVRSLAPLEDAQGIRVSAVAPGLIKTPLWTEAPDKVKIIDEEVDEWAMPEEVADGMLMLLECADLPGGTILEIRKNSKRVVQVFNDPGPHGTRISASRSGLLVDDVLEILRQKRAKSSS